MAPELTSRHDFLKDYIFSINSNKRSLFSFTYRRYDWGYGFAKILEDWVILKSKYSDLPEELEIEFCIIDTNPSLDEKWIKNDVS